MQHISGIMKSEPRKPVYAFRCAKCQDYVWAYPGPYCECKSGDACEILWREYLASVEQGRKQRFRKLQEQLKKAGGFVIPERYKDYTPKSLAKEYGMTVYNQKKGAIEQIMNWADDKAEKPGMVLSGDFGTGKTALALWAMSRRIRQTHEAPLLIRYADFIGSIQETYNRNSDVSRRELISGAQSAEAMMLDDFGEVGLPLGQQASNDKQTILLEVLDYRTQNDLPTLIVTNLTIARMMAQFNGAIIGRLTELCALVEMGGKNLREKGAMGW
jgi:DNA replication protein DnaC